MCVLDEEELRLLLVLINGTFIRRDCYETGLLAGRDDWVNVVFKRVDLKAWIARQIRERGAAMTNDRANEGRQDQAWPGAVRWELGDARGHMTETLWRCDALRAGRLYQRSLFGTREEADAFVEKMQESGADLMFNVEAIMASAVWN